MKTEWKRNFRPKALFAAICTVALVLSSTNVKAQDVAVGQATATVQAILTVTSSSALAFGTIFQGVPTTIANNNANAGVFTITGQGASGLSIFMQLPDYLSTATGDDRLVVAFSTTDASVDSTTNTTSTTFGVGWQNTNPHNFNSAVTMGGGGQAAIFLGGKVLPTVDQAAGAYTGDIILTVAYNGT